MPQTLIHTWRPQVGYDCPLQSLQSELLWFTGRPSRAAAAALIEPKGMEVDDKRYEWVAPGTC